MTRNRSSVHLYGENSVHCNLESPGTRSSAIQMRVSITHRCLDKVLNSTVVNRTCPSINVRSLEIMLTVPLKHSWSDMIH